ncbi:hypothetical protein KVR01_009347 [Diaporthe batatas]|uniref:uncharacterized protein n=1 Tax=Diaporthe batatas TaxID=748121 RepID=UPI001D057E7D|nr:uncharacterized protein KVR01_009347 [Diaporthe batatas]KAG8161083.1 hypothetical protein KVR01_009347 [Diaporthe batatas]
MKPSQLAVFLSTALCQLAAAKPCPRRPESGISSVVSGTPVGFASAVTGGGTAEPVYPKTIDELTEYLTSPDPQVVVISGEYDFRGSEGTEMYPACNQYACTPENGGQALLNTLNGCNMETYDVEVDKAGYQGINVANNKTLVGKDNATLIGKGLRFVDTSNIIVQNLAITNLNPKYVWGGDAVSFSGTENIWVDHVTTSSTGRQHYVFGHDASKGVTISNSFINGETAQSSTCNNQTYWAMELVGADDQITFYRNHVTKTSGRTPALSGGTLLHAVNNVWSDNGGHLIEGDSDGARGLYEGNYMENVPNALGSDFAGQLFIPEASDASQCAAALGRDCVPNELTKSGEFSSSDTGVLSEFKGQSIPKAEEAEAIKDTVPTEAGNTL